MNAKKDITHVIRNMIIIESKRIHMRTRMLTVFSSFAASENADNYSEQRVAAVTRHSISYS